MYLQHSHYDIRAVKRVFVSGLRADGKAASPYLTWISVQLWADEDGRTVTGFDLNGTPEQLRDLANQLESAVQKIEAIAAKQQAEATQTHEEAS